MSAAPREQPNYEQQDPDVRLMLQVRDGASEVSSAAFEELVLRYQSRLLTVLEHLVSNRELAEDLAQEVFLRVFRARQRYAPEARFSTWLFTIANNVASNALRSKSRRREVGVPEKSNGSDTSPFGLDQMAKAASALMPTRALDKAESAEIVRMAMESLNDRQRLALLLSKFEGMSYQDIAKTMDLSVQAIKSLLSRARVNLEKILTPYVEEGVRPDQSVAPAAAPDESGQMSSGAVP
ncbi:MAG TPA: sigma-70 family RNA polymerase sigma factor [Pirellulaceae bacterium]|nr:sigma-70 family RNA polymerase sigma factor [Pirellulaceae bacterium]